MERKNYFIFTDGRDTKRYDSIKDTFILLKNLQVKLWHYGEQLSMYYLLLLVH